MNKTLKFALSAVLGVAMVAPALAQGAPDVPENHWARQSVENLWNKVLFGYPDGFFRGSRMMTRYEFAVAVDKLWQAMNSQFEGVNSKLDALQRKIDGAGGGTDTSGLSKQIADLRKDVDGMKGWGTAISDMQKLTKEFEKDLADIGVDVDAMKKDQADMKKRIEALEAKKNAINIGAYVDLLVLAGHSSDNNFGLMPDGTVVGVGEGSYAGLPVGMTRDLTVLHEAAFKFSGGEDGSPKWKGTLVVGNILDSFGDFSTRVGGSFSEGNTDIYFRDFSVTFGGELVGQGFEAEIGRVAHQVGPYIWKRTSYTKEYYNNSARNSGDWYFDGGILNFNFGKVDLSVFGGRNSDRRSTNGIDLNPDSLYTDGTQLIDQTLGVQLGVPIGDQGSVNLAYLWHDSNNLSNFGMGNVNRKSVFGADINLKFGNVGFWGSYAQSVLSENTTTRNDEDNTAYDARLHYSGNNFAVGGGYRRVEGMFAASGSWGRTGTWYNPTNVQGFNAMVSFNPSSDLKIWGKGEVLEGVDNALGGFLGEDDQSVSFTVGLDYKLSNYFDLGIKYEDVKFDYDAGTDPYQRWLTFALGYNMSSNSKLMFTYTYSDVDFKGRTGAGEVGGGFGANRFKGGLLGTQLSIKF
ncbi:hypothetical protein QPK87_30860 [Kamptonema cortianum]|nr:hypothetical protein [Geitlerinema splendidum]MDK3160926.1 hypothetical protein [Kamptonema cortianum]